MNQDVHPVTAFAVIVIGVCLIGFIFWARGEALNVGGPDQVQYDHQGNVFIHTGGVLHKYSLAFNPLAQYELAEIGVYDFVGDFAFFANGDMLIRRGKYQPGVVESIRRYASQRLADYNVQLAARKRLPDQRCSDEEIVLGECAVSQRDNWGV